MSKGRGQEMMGRKIRWSKVIGGFEDQSRKFVMDSGVQQPPPVERGFLLPKRNLLLLGYEQ